ncbi:hypothetical protein WICPIJ_000737 [Wickerhamomyces pijperi]|uniref:Uncharacterized protein n=1 Tax=Wickerhamomyces pijperi TaxID=599730 RepID=A0A9P8TS51_WICPI|nr:hypothetical protein WICPIJ_000737 [Wickerhamomyces pijperi]
MLNSPPVKAVTKSISFSITKSSPDLLKMRCFFSWTTKTTSPGVTPGSWSPSPLKTILWPSLKPGSMCTCNTFLSVWVFLPLQVLQRSFGSTMSPEPEQVSQWTCILWIIGPICLVTNLIPLPPQTVHFLTAPALPPRPSQGLQRTVLFKAILATRPLYSSSKVAPMACLMS